jgi:ribosome biogenesis GTPase
LKTGIVIKSTGSWYTVKSDDGVKVDCKIKGNFRIKGIRATNPLTVGDKVEFIINANEDTGVITNIKERKNYIIRKSSNLSFEYQLIAANVDLAWIMISLISPRTLTGFIDRFLITAEAYSIPSILLFNKTDIYGPKERKELEELKRIYSEIGYECMEISVKENQNIEKLKDRLKDKVNVISGNSGVGKSSLINLIQPHLKLKTGLISDAHQSGKHTTTFAEMYELDFGGYVIDTPGIKGFGLIDFDKEELSHFFPEIFNYSRECQFHNCSHYHEPGCAVKQAVDENKISESRYISYLNILLNEDDKYRN